ncbi:MAG: TetR/AcrR family transcriptional regulator [Acidiferrobacter sp.]
MARPMRFTREEILDKAIHAFWDHGYCATGMADLVTVTDLQPGSLYGAFHSKQGLFRAAPEHYGQVSETKIKVVLTEAATPLEGIRQFFRNVTKDVSGTEAKRSCFLVNTVLEVARQNEAVRKQVNTDFNRIEAMFRDALEKAQSSGELSCDKDPKSLATFLMTNIWGLRILGGVAPSPKRTLAVVNQVLAVLE